MPVTKIKVTFAIVAVHDSADLWGDANWSFTASVDKAAVGTTDQFVARQRQFITLPQNDWTAIVDVSGKGKNGSVKISFSGRNNDTFVRTRDLGEVKYTFKYPFCIDQDIQLKSPLKKNRHFYTLLVKMEVLEIKATTTLSGPKSVTASRQHDGSTTFSTVSGRRLLPRVEVGPVVPTPQAPSRLPRRPPVSVGRGLTPGKNTPQSKPAVMWPLPQLNALCNPSLIPILSLADPDLNNKAARLAVTYIEPGDLDPSFLTWVIKSGPAQIIGSKRGPEILVVGTGTGATDQLAEFEVRWDGVKGTLLATFRAWVGKIKTVSYRINLINGPDAASQVVFPPQDYANQMQMARIVHWQAGIDLVPDTDTTCWDRASTKDSTGAALPAGVFIVPVSNQTWTVNVNNFVPTIASRLNFRPGALHAVYVRSTTTGRAAATDIQGVDGKDYELGGKPTSSWVIPSGVPPDADPTQKLKLKTFESSNRPTKKAPGDDVYATARSLADKKFQKSDMGRIYAVVLPSDWSWGNNTGSEPNAGVNLAHELGHALGLHHRGSGDATNPPLSNDNINSVDNTGAQRGHPWNENVMTYGYGGALAAEPRALDIDLIQTPIVRKHPACK